MSGWAPPPKPKRKESAFQGGDFEAEIEQAFWMFDDERERTGDPREAFKRQMRMMRDSILKPGEDQNETSEEEHY